ncbi:MAG: type II secretion system protein [Cytophagales bacterium]|nr:type II secretion system protein [Rhizobacter sp.]
MTPRLASYQRGFTLIEAVIVIMLTGIVGAMLAMFIRAPVNAYVDQARRGELTDEADGALRRIARDLQTALPNSVRVSPSGNYLELLPVRSAGRYRALPSSTGTGDYLDFNLLSDNSFDVLGPPVSVSAQDELVIYNLGLTGADAYAGTSRRAIPGPGGTFSNISYTVGAAQFPYASPSNRFHIIGKPITYGCTAPVNGVRSLRRYTGYSIQAAQPANAGGAPLSGLTGGNNALLAGSVTACLFTYNSAASARKAVVTLRLTLTRSTESVTLLQQVFVENSP